nr:uncharacterized protein LOC126528425 [Dermacentor andersoni]
MIRKRSGLARIIHVHPLRTFFLVRELVIYIMVGTLPRRQQDAISRTLLTAVQDFSPILKRSLHVLRNVRLGAMTACTLVIAKELLVAALTPCARLCDLVHGQLAPLSLPSLWLSLPELPQVLVDKTTTEAITMTAVVTQGSTTTTILKTAPLRVLCFLASTDDSLGALSGGVCSKMVGAIHVGYKVLNGTGLHWPALPTCILSGLIFRSMN